MDLESDVKPWVGIVLFIWNFYHWKQRMFIHALCVPQWETKGMAVFTVNLNGSSFKENSRIFKNKWENVSFQI